LRTDCQEFSGVYDTQNANGDSGFVSGNNVELPDSLGRND